MLSDKCRQPEHLARSVRFPTVPCHRVGRRHRASECAGWVGRGERNASAHLLGHVPQAHRLISQDRGDDGQTERDGSEIADNGETPNCFQCHSQGFGIGNGDRTGGSSGGGPKMDDSALQVAGSDGFRPDRTSEVDDGIGEGLEAFGHRQMSSGERVGPLRVELRGKQLLAPAGRGFPVGIARRDGRSRSTTGQPRDAQKLVLSGGTDWPRRWECLVSGFYREPHG